MAECKRSQDARNPAPRKGFSNLLRDRHKICFRHLTTWRRGSNIVMTENRTRGGCCGDIVYERGASAPPKHALMMLQSASVVPCKQGDILHLPACGEVGWGKRRFPVAFTAEAVPCRTKPASAGYNPAQAGFGLHRKAKTVHVYPNDHARRTAMRRGLLHCRVRRLCSNAATCRECEGGVPYLFATRTCVPPSSAAAAG